MPFMILAHDYPDALAKRMEARPRHVELCEKMKKAGTMTYGVALTDESGNMRGSMLVIDLPTRADVDAYLAEEPYVVDGVWEKIYVTSCKVGPSFAVAKAA